MILLPNCVIECVSNERKLLFFSTQLHFFVLRYFYKIRVKRQKHRNIERERESARENTEQLIRKTLKDPETLFSFSLYIYLSIIFPFLFLWCLTLRSIKVTKNLDKRSIATGQIDKQRHFTITHIIQVL